MPSEAAMLNGASQVDVAPTAAPVPAPMGPTVAELEATIQMLQDRIRLQRDENTELELQLIELRRANDDLDQQLQLHTRSTQQAAQQIAELNERVLDLNRANANTIGQPLQRGDQDGGDNL